MRILIVDDDLHRQQTMGEALRERFGDIDLLWMARSAADAIVMLRYLERETWDVLFLDHDLAGGDWPDSQDGRTVARAIKSLKVKAKQIIIQSVNAWSAKEMKAILKGRKVSLSPFPECLELIEEMDFDTTPTTATT